MRTINGALLASAVSAGLLLSGTAGAQEVAGFDWSVSAGATYSDNVGRVAEQEESETTGTLGLQFNLQRPEGRLTANAAADLAFDTYFDDTYDDELNGNLSALVSYQFVPEFFSWMVQDTYGQTLIDAQAVETPGNRQGTNVFTTGPDITVRLGAKTSLILQGRWSDAAYEDSDTDNQRLSGTLTLMRRLSEASYVSLNGSATRVEYDDVPPNSNYDINSAYLGYGIAGVRTTLDVTAGMTAQHDFGESSDGPLFDLTLSRRLSPRSQLTLRAGTLLADTLDAFMRDYDTYAGGQQGSGAVVSNDPYQQDYASVEISLNGDRNLFRLSADWRQDDHEQNDELNRESLGFSGGYTRRIRSNVSFDVDGRWEQEDFTETGVEFDDWSVGVGLDWGFARGFTLGLSAYRYEGSGDTSTGVDTRDYVENRYSIDITYRPAR